MHGSICRQAVWGMFAATLLVCFPPAHGETPEDDFSYRSVDFTQDESTGRPAPSWVRMVDQGEQNPELAGIMTPAGIKVEIVADAPNVIDPVALTFDENGTPYVLEWRMADESKHIRYEVTFQDGTTGNVNRMWKNTRDELKRLIDADGDGHYEAVEVILDDLEIPSSVKVRDGWVYLSSLGQITRRQQAADGNFGDPQMLIQGLCGFHHHQASGMTFSHDGWLYVTSGDDDNRGEASDGTRATVLRTGAIMQVRPDGTQISEFARGFRNPYRDVALDHMFNIFHVDNDQEDGSKFQGCRLMHIQEGADYGWRLATGTVCCRTDFERGAVFGEKPGKMPSMLKTGRGSPAGLLIYQSEQFPDFFRGLLIYPDVFRKKVRAYSIERIGSTFAVTSQFDLMSSEDGLFRPCQAVVGPDGAIYIVDWRTDSGGAGRLWGDGQHGRIYRLSWGGTDEVPAIPLAPMDSWAKIRTADDATLWEQLDTADFEIRFRVLDELVRRGEENRQKFINVALDTERTAPARAAAIGGASRFYDAAVQQAMVQLLTDKDFEIRRLAADAISRHVTAETLSDEVLMALQDSLADEHPSPRRAKALALGRLAALYDEDAPQRQLSAQQLRDALLAADPQDRYLWDGILRGLERTEETGINLLVELVRGDDADQRELGVVAFESLRTRPAVAGLNQLVAEDSTPLSDNHTARLLATYRNILLEPAVDPAAVGQWLQRNADASAEVQLAALETLALLGASNPQQTLPFVLELLKNDDPQTRLSVLGVVGENHLVGAAPTLAEMLADASRPLAERSLIVSTLGRLRQQDLPFGDKTEKGVELVLDELVAAAGEMPPGPLRRDTIAIVASVDYSRALPVAETMLGSDDPADIRAAITVLAPNRKQALKLGQMFVAGQLSRDLLPQVAAALERHAGGPNSEEVSTLLAEVFRGGLLVSLEPAEITRVEELVQTTGDPAAGRAVFLHEKSQCIKCHKLEGVGNTIGPDLTKVWDTQTVAKLLEAIIAPSKEIKEGFQTYTAVTDSGQVYQGLKVAETDREVVLRDAEGRDVSIPKANLDEFEASDKSLMPEGVTAQLSFQEFVDLIAFLKSAEQQEALASLPVDAWLVGPLAHALDGPEGEEILVPGAEVLGADGQPLPWQRVVAGAEGMFDLFPAVPHENAAAVLITHIYSPTEQTVPLDVFFDDEVKLFIGETEIHRSTNVHQVERVEVPLVAGWNRLQARVVNHSGGFAVRLTPADTNRGIRFAAEPPQETAGK